MVGGYWDLLNMGNYLVKLEEFEIGIILIIKWIGILVLWEFLVIIFRERFVLCGFFSLKKLGFSLIFFCNFIFIKYLRIIFVKFK